MMEPSPEQTREDNGNWTSAGKNKGKCLQILKKHKRITIKETDGVATTFPIKPQDHGIKKALLERPLVADTSVILQNLIIEILHTTTEENVKGLILTALKKIKWETELFTKQLEKHIVEAEVKKKAEVDSSNQFIDLSRDFSVDRKLTEAERVKVKQRDGYTCLCCGANTEIKLQISHIKPLSFGGEVSVENSQTLCFTCYYCQGDNEMDFRCNTTKLSIQENLDLSFKTESTNAITTLTRIVNLFYHCKAVNKVYWEVRPYTYNIYLHPGNNPEWLLKHKEELLKYIQEKLGRNAYHINVTAIE